MTGTRDTGKDIGNLERGFIMHAVNVSSSLYVKLVSKVYSKQTFITYIFVIKHIHSLTIFLLHAGANLCVVKRFKK